MVVVNGSLSGTRVLLFKIVVGMTWPVEKTVSLHQGLRGKNSLILPLCRFLHFVVRFGFIIIFSDDEGFVNTYVLGVISEQL